MGRKLGRTMVVAVVSAAALLFLVLPMLDAMGRMLLMPPSYFPSARGLVVALWLLGVAATWAYRPPETGDDRDGGGSEVE